MGLEMTESLPREPTARFDPLDHNTMLRMRQLSKRHKGGSLRGLQISISRYFGKRANCQM